MLNVIAHMANKKALTGTRRCGIALSQIERISILSPRIKRRKGPGGLRRRVLLTLKMMKKIEIL
jgi:hypothetical protein